jgi:hypothetical protein
MQDSIEMMSPVMMAELALFVETEKERMLAPPPNKSLIYKLGP